MTTTNTNCYVGTLAAVATNSTFNNNVVGATITGSNLRGVGGLVGKGVDTSFNNNKFSGTLGSGSAVAVNVGGIVGEMQNTNVTTKIDSCSVDQSTIYATGFAGGVLGYSSSYVQVSGSSVEDSTLYTTSDLNATNIENKTASAGGIVGYITSSTQSLINSCHTKNITLTANSGGGIVGFCNNVKIISCCARNAHNNTASNQSVCWFGGIAGEAISSSIIACEFLMGSTAIGYVAAGGIVGFSADANTVIRMCCVNSFDGYSSAYTLQGSYVGGIVGIITNNPVMQYNKVYYVSITGVASQGTVGYIFGEYLVSTPTTSTNATYNYTYQCSLTANGSATKKLDTANVTEYYPNMAVTYTLVRHTGKVH